MDKIYGPQIRRQVGNDIIREGLPPQTISTNYLACINHKAAPNHPARIIVTRAKVKRSLSRDPFITPDIMVKDSCFAMVLNPLDATELNYLRVKVDSSRQVSSPIELNLNVSRANSTAARSGAYSKLGIMVQT